MYARVVATLWFRQASDELNFHPRNIPFFDRDVDVPFGGHNTEGRINDKAIRKHANILTKCMIGT